MGGGTNRVDVVVFVLVYLPEDGWFATTTDEVGTSCVCVCVCVCV